jgi:hypothetical protein
MINSNKSIINNSNVRNLILTEDKLPDITTLSSNITTEGNTNRNLCANNKFKYNTNATTSVPLNHNSITVNVYAAMEAEFKNPKWITISTSTEHIDGNTANNVYDTSAKWAILDIYFKSHNPPLDFNKEELEIDWGPNLDSHHYKVLYNIDSVSGTTINSQNFEWWRGRPTMYLQVYHSSKRNYSYHVEIRFQYLD